MRAQTKQEKEKVQEWTIGEEGSMIHESQEEIINQPRIRKGRILVAGKTSGLEHFAAAATGLGVGTATYISDGSLGHNMFSQADSPAAAIASKARRIYDEGNYTSATLEELCDWREQFDCVVDLYKDVDASRRLMNFALGRNLPYISISMGEYDVEMIYVAPDQHVPSHQEKEAGNIAAATKEIYREMETTSLSEGVAAAAGVDWVRHILSTEELDYVLQNGDVFYHSFEGRQRGKKDKKRLLQPAAGAKALVVGAGSIGTYVALQAALNGFETVDIIDADEIESRNLNRQVLYYDLVGHPKAESLLSRLQEFTNIQGKAINQKLTENNIAMLNEYDVVFSCVDKLKPRQIINQYAREHNIFAIDGGTNAFGGSLATYIPGKTRCIACKRNIDGEELVIETGCGVVKEPSVIIPNMMIGTLMVGEALYTLSRGKQESIDHAITYDSHQCKIGEREYYLKNNCDCQRR